MITKVESSGHEPTAVPGSAPVSCEDAAKLARVRDVLAAFDWERDDRQYALEAIDRIVFGGEN